MNTNNIIDLDECILQALTLFTTTKLPKLDINFKRPIVIGSGSALVTGKILFEDKDAIFANESNYQKNINLIKTIDGAVIVSSSGGKHAPEISKYLRKKGIKTILITNNNNALANKYVDKTIVFPKQVEPYTYNVSTYLGMILAKTKENPKQILNHILKIANKIPNNLNSYDAFYFIVPERLDLAKEMLTTKFDELFGSIISARAYTFEQSKHAKTIIPSEKELFVGLGYKNTIFGNNKLNLLLNKNGNYASIISLGYYLIGKIQKQNKPYFKDNIKDYTKFSSRIFGQNIDIIVE